MGCATLYETPTDHNFKSNEFPTRYEADEEIVKTRKILPEIKEKTILVVSAKDDRDPKLYVDFLKASFTGLGITEVLSFEEFQQKLIKAGKIDDLRGVSSESILGLAQFAKAEPSILWLESEVKFHKSWCHMDMKIVDPRTGETVFEYKDKRFVIVNPNSECIYPMMNAARDWYLESAEGAKVGELHSGRH